MGAVTDLLLMPVMAPVWGFRFVLEQLRDEADAAMHDEGRAYAELIDLSMRHSAGQLSDEEHAEQEAALLDRLRSIRDYRNELQNEQPDEDDEDWAPDEEQEEEGEDWPLDGESQEDVEDWQLDAEPDADEAEEGW